MSKCVFCNDDCGENIAENPPREWLLGSNLKIRSYKGRSGGAKTRSTFDLPPGDPEYGGFCLSRTPACSGCYATLGAIIFVSADQRRLMNAQVFLGGKDKWVRDLIDDIRLSGSPIVRIHGFGDFFSAEYVRAWGEVVRSLPKIKFFGTTRMWLAAFQPTKLMPAIVQASASEQTGVVNVQRERRDRDEFLKALDEFRSISNVSLGASVEGASYHSGHEKFVPGDPLGRRIPGTGTAVSTAPNHRDRVLQRGPFAGKTLVEYLRAHGFNIWNMLSEFSDPNVRRRLGVKVASGRGFARAATQQFEVARREGFMVGNIGCPEQMKKLPDCVTCRRCTRRADGTGRWDINFAFHPGKGLQEQAEEVEVRRSWGLPDAEESAREHLSKLGFGGRGGTQRYAEFYRQQTQAGGEKQGD